MQSNMEQKHHKMKEMRMDVPGHFHAGPSSAGRSVKQDKDWKQERIDRLMRTNVYVALSLITSEKSISTEHTNEHTHMYDTQNNACAYLRQARLLCRCPSSECLLDGNAHHITCYIVLQ